MDEAKRSKASAARTQIPAEIRTSAYAAHGIKLLSGEAKPQVAIAAPGFDARNSSSCRSL